MADNIYELVISIHILPYELEDYRRILTQLNQSTKHTNISASIIIHTTLNLNGQLTNWDKSTLSKDETINLYNEINRTNPFQESVHEIDSDILGVDDHRRNSIQKYKSLTNHMSFLDCDIHFNKTHLGHLLRGLTKLSSITEYYILSPQLVKLWDNTWNCLVNNKYRMKSFNYHKVTDPRLIVNQTHGKVGIYPLRQFKWGGGWFNGFSMNLLSYVGIPDTFIGYGLDDTFIMEGARAMAKHNHSIKQYVLKNSVVMEDYINLNDTFKNNFEIYNIRNKLLKHCKENYKKECDIFLTKLKKVPYI